MTRRATVSGETDALDVGGFPDGMAAGSTVLVASAGNPTPAAVGLQAVCRYGRGDDSALVVTTTESADRTIERYERVRSGRDGPSIRIADTTADQGVSAMYNETPVVHTPSPGDLERLVLALSELSADEPPTNGNRHLIVQSLTPILETTPTERVCTVLDRITGLRSEAGLCVLGIDYTAHDEATMSELAERVDGILWITQSASDEAKFEYRSTRKRRSGSMENLDPSSN